LFYRLLSSTKRITRGHPKTYLIILQTSGGGGGQGFTLGFYLV